MSASPYEPAPPAPSVDGRATRSTAVPARAGMELARPDPAARTAVSVYRGIHLALPVVLCGGLLLLVEPVP